MSAGSALTDEPLGEERLEDRRDRAHDRAPLSWRVSRRWAASESSSGVAVRYQYVDMGTSGTQNCF